jgi:hypothetical protein
MEDVGNSFPLLKWQNFAHLNGYPCKLFILCGYLVGPPRAVLSARLCIEGVRRWWFRLGLILWL